MSVIITIEFPGLQADKYAEAFQRHPERMERISKDAQSQGAIHHRFAANDDGTVVAFDEWDSRESCERFLANQEEIKTIMGEFEWSGQPIIRSYEVMDAANGW